MDSIEEAANYWSGSKPLPKGISKPLSPKWIDPVKEGHLPAKTLYAITNLRKHRIGIIEKIEQVTKKRNPNFPNSCPKGTFKEWEELMNELFITNINIYALKHIPTLRGENVLSRKKD